MTSDPDDGEGVETAPPADPIGIAEALEPGTEPAVEPEVLPAPSDLGIELPADPDEAVQVLVIAVAHARAEAMEYLDTLQRVAAEFDNYRKRVERSQVDNLERASRRIIETLLPTLDNFDAALGYEPQSPVEEKILDGMKGTHAQLLEALGAEGLEPISALGEPFDPALHEAVSGPAADSGGDLIVTKELRRGYRLRDRIIRPSLVTVEHD